SLPSFDNDFEAFPAGSNGGISVAAGDVNGDGTPDIVAGAGPGEAPEVAVFNGRDGAPLGTFAAFKSKFTGGVNVAVADVDLDGQYDIVASLGGEGDDVRAFDGKTFEQKDAWDGPKTKRGVALAGVRR
ncbi:MAG TPA: FG-GAP repeat protein, partial [Solirubrobacterales bacterium]|nr:FG-GAP repeat protein [Solirubrobacterales bacterium]